MYIDNINNNFDNPVTKPIIDAFGIEETVLNEHVEDTKKQMFVESATWGLDKWETMLGIGKNNFDIQIRRENIKAKMRSRGATTIQMLKSVCESYSNGEVDIIVDHANYSFVIDFVGTIGIPVAFAELDKTVNEIKPCHLAHSYKYNFNTHKDLSEFTHEQLANYTHDELRNSPNLRGGA